MRSLFHLSNAAVRVVDRRVDHQRRVAFPLGHADGHNLEKLTDAMVSVEGESMRQVTWVTIEDVKSGQWGIGGKALTTEAVKLLAAREKNARIKFRLISGYWNVEFALAQQVQFRLRRHEGMSADTRESFMEDFISALADRSASSLVAVSAHEFEYVYFSRLRNKHLLGIRIAHERRQQSQHP